MKRTIIILASVLFVAIYMQAQTVTDIDGNVYNTITIGSQVWMKENLKVTHYQNGNPIPVITPTNLWNSATTPARCYYNNDSASNKAVYGGLYNWYVVNDSRNVCPFGWHVPDNDDWSTMEVLLGSDTISIGGMMKEPGTTHWITPNTGATNSSGFTALPGGTRTYDGTFFNMTNYGYFWTSTAVPPNSAKMRYLTYDDANLHNDEYSILSGFSIRCVYDVLLTKLNDINLNQIIDIYPNPSANKVYIACAARQDLKMLIYNMIGDCVFQRVLTSGTNEIDISSLITGIYIIQLTGADRTIQRKLIKE